MKKQFVILSVMVALILLVVGCGSGAVTVTSTTPPSEPTSEPTIQPTNPPAVTPTSEPTTEPTIEPTADARSSIASVVEEFMTALKDKDYDNAYGLWSDALQSEAGGDVAGLETWAQDNAVFPLSWTAGDITITGDSANLVMTVAWEDQTDWLMVVDLILDNGQWLIDVIDFTLPSEPTIEPTTDAQSTIESVADADVVVLPLSAYVDGYGYYHVVGAVQNNSEDAIANVELSLTLVDDAGESVLTEGDTPVAAVTFFPHLYTLATGESSPFDFIFFPGEGVGTEGLTPSITITSLESVEANSASVRVENQKLVVDAEGNFYLTGEIINEEDNGVILDGIAGAMLDNDGNIVGAAQGFGYAYYLYPASDDTGSGSRTPYIVRVDGPIETADSALIYFDVKIASASDEPADVNLTLQDTAKNNYYIDEYGSAYLVTAVTNNGSTPVAVRLVAGLYAENGEVLDADAYFSPIYIQPGETFPVRSNYFTSVSSNAEVSDAVSSYTIQIDPHPSSTYEETSFAPLNLPAEEAVTDSSASISDDNWTVSGTFTNSSDRHLSSAVVLVVFYDKESGNIMATAYTNIYPDSDVLAPGDTQEFEIYIQLDPGVDAASLYEYDFIVQGYPIE